MNTLSRNRQTICQGVKYATGLHVKISGNPTPSSRPKEHNGPVRVVKPADPEKVKKYREGLNAVKRGKR